MFYKSTTYKVVSHVTKYSINHSMIRPVSIGLIIEYIGVGNET